MRKLLLATIAGLATLFISAQNAETVQNSEQLKHANAAGKDGGKYPDYSMDILRESETNSKVMNYAFNLTDVSGPRLTASPGFTKAANWAREELTRMGLVNARLESWGEFGKGWQQERCYVAMTAPYYQPIIAVPRAWTGSTPGNKAINSEVLLIKAKDSVALSKYAGKLQGKIVMIRSPAELKPSFTADATRFTEEELEKMAQAKPSEGRGNNRPALSQADSVQRAERMTRLAMQRRIDQFLANEKPGLVLSMNANGTDGTIFVSGGGSYKKDGIEGPASIMLSSDDFLRLQRLIEAGIKVQVEADVKTKFFNADLNGYNVIAEIPGTDPTLKDEVVMLGGHLDSWHAATGATDNAAGCAVMMEAVRIIKALPVAPKRTIRIALWSGEEQGLLGSRNYVKTNFADPATMVLKPAHEKISGYFNLDNGSGRIRGVYLQGNKAVMDIFSGWLAPFVSRGAKTVTLNNTGGTDHLAFDAVGIPGFQFIQDELEYDTRTHHTNMDTYDHLSAEDLRQAAAVVAAFVYNTAQLDQKLPRKELPKPTGGNRGF